MAKVYIIILNYKKWIDVQECLETLFRSSYTHFCAIVIDNDSQNNSLQHLISWANTFDDAGTSFSRDKNRNAIPYQYFKSSELNESTKASEFSKLVFIQNTKNKGFAKGINTALRLLIHEDAYTWLLNPDMTVATSTIMELVNFAAAMPLRAVIGAVIKYYANDQRIHLYGGGKINFNSATIEMIAKKENIMELDYISGGALFTHASNFAVLGLLPEEYFLYWEETDWCYNAKQQGYKLCVCETAICYDKVSTSIGKNFLSDFYYTRNGLFFLSKYKSKKVKRATFFTFFRMAKRIVSGKFGRAKGMYQGMLSFLKTRRA